MPQNPPPAASSATVDPSAPVRLEPTDASGTSDALGDLATAAASYAGRGVPPALAWADELGARLPRPGGGTRHLWEALATIAAQDLTVARIVEPHLDALAILGELTTVPSGSRAPSVPTPAGVTYGVWAAEGPAPRLEATHDTDGTWRLQGRKPWCSLAGDVSHALVTAWMSEDRRGLFLLDLAAPGVHVRDGSWSTLGLRDVVTSSVDLDRTPATPVGGPGWYLARDGFAWGGIGVAAIWYGGAVGLARRLRADLIASSARRTPDQVALLHLGAVDAALVATRALLADAATEVDAGRAAGADGALLAARVRQSAADTAESVLHHVGHGLGPGPLAHDPVHARRVADLGLYVRQHHGERDLAATGRMLLADPAAAGW